VQLEFHGQREPLTHTLQPMRIWLRVSTVKTLTTLRNLKRNNMAKKFKTHMMCKKDKCIKVTSMAEHFKLKKDGYTHTKKK